MQSSMLPQRSRTRRWVQAMLLLLLGLFFVDTMLSGRITNYVNQAFAWLGWFAGIVFLLLGILNVVELLREPPHHEGDAMNVASVLANLNVPSAPSWAVLSVIAVPLVLGVLVPARPLGASAIAASGFNTSLSGASGSSAASFAIPPEQRNVLDWVRSFGNAASLSEFAEQPVDVVGFVYRDVELDSTSQFFIMRFTVSCCVADASSLGLIIESATAQTLQADTWVRVKGKIQLKAARGQAEVPVIQAASVEVVDQPEHPYLYP